MWKKTSEQTGHLMNTYAHTKAAALYWNLWVGGHTHTHTSKSRSWWLCCHGDLSLAESCPRSQCWYETLSFFPDFLLPPPTIALFSHPAIHMFVYIYIHTHTPLYCQYGFLEKVYLHVKVVQVKAVIDLVIFKITIFHLLLYLMTLT